MNESKITVIYGHCELKEFSRLENGKRVSYGYRVDYDENGFEVSRTEPTQLMTIWFG